ncbi:hypothetical protein CRENBAI_019328 [Crenichthys baileyi]|uniref:Uncharacterized protein n=1 Tax=Crenichthys baileyi TaxID=28760 RepID=A0AAV9QTX2_9TELE
MRPVVKTCTEHAVIPVRAEAEKQRRQSLVALWRKAEAERRRHIEEKRFNPQQIPVMCKWKVWPRSCGLPRLIRRSLKRSRFHEADARLFANSARILSMLLLEFLHSGAQFPHSLDPRKSPPEFTAVDLLTTPWIFFLKTIAQPLTSCSLACPLSNAIRSTAHLLLEIKKQRLDYQITKYHHLSISDCGFAHLLQDIFIHHQLAQ